MQKIIINEFGPLNSLTIDVSKFLVFIGPQASGKSSISKNIYFFKSLRDDLLRYVIESIEQDNFEKPLGTFAKKIRAKFLDFWGATYSQSKISIEYFYSEDVSIKIYLKGSYINPDFSPSFQEKFKRIIRESESFLDNNRKKNQAFMSSSEMLALESDKRIFLKRIEELAIDLFSEGREMIFIPAGRSLLSVLSDQLQVVHPRKLDYLMRAFLDRINNSKNIFNKSLEALVVERKKLTQVVIDTNRVNLAQEIIPKILKGHYRYDSDGEKLYFSENKYTKLNYSSSGQQESIWILLLIFVLILDRKNVFLVLEEPEAHLYPEAQKDIIDLISLVAGMENNQVVLTTHSPYVLSALNNLLYADHIGKKRGKDVSKIIKPELWIDSNGFQAFFINKNQTQNIMDHELNLIKTEAIDSASSVINSIYNKLFDLDE